MSEPSRPGVVFAVTALGVFMGSLDLSIVNVAFPSLEASFPHDTTAALTWVLTGYGVVFGALLVTAGRTADRVGGRRVFFAGLLVFCAGSALCGVAPALPELVAGRLVEGAGAAAMLPSSLGLLLGAFPAGRRAQVVAAWSGVGALAIATGPTIGAGLVALSSWRLVFDVNLPLGLAAYLVGRRVLAPSRGIDAGAAPDYPGVALVTVALAALVLGIAQGPSWGWSSPAIVAAFVAAAVLGVAFVRRSARHPAPVLDLSLFADRSFGAANLATLLYAMGFFAMMLANMLFLTGVWHWSVLAAGLAVTPGPLVVAAASWPAGRLAARIGFRPVLASGAVLFSGGLAWYATRVGVRPDYLGAWLPAVLVTGAGIGLTFPVLGAAAVSRLPPDRFAVGSAVNQTARQVGGALGIALLAVLLGAASTGPAALSHYRHLWWFAAGMAVLSGLASQLLDRPREAPGRRRRVAPSTATISARPRESSGLRA